MFPHWHAPLGRTSQMDSGTYSKVKPTDRIGDRAGACREYSQFADSWCEDDRAP